MHVVIAGGTGLIGGALSRSLLADQHQVSVLTRDPSVGFLREILPALRAAGVPASQRDAGQPTCWST